MRSLPLFAALSLNAPVQASISRTSGSVHQEDDTPLGVTWRDSAQLGAFGRIGHLGKYTKTRQFPQILIPRHANSPKY